MSSGLASLHKILKDETRSKAILLLSEKGALSYTGLMEGLGIVSTGTLNYHLKVLGDLLLKTEKGQYALTEKGKIAANLLREYPDDAQEQRTRELKKFWTVAAIIQFIFLISVFALYFLNLIEAGRFILYTVTFVASLGFCYLGYSAQIRVPKFGSEEEWRRGKVGYVIIGIMSGLAVGFFGPMLIILAVRSLGGPDLAHAEGGGEVGILLAIIGPIAGAVLGYWYGKKTRF